MMASFAAKFFSQAGKLEVQGRIGLHGEFSLYSDKQRPGAGSEI
jgi:hypothetical protein